MTQSYKFENVVCKGRRFNFIVHDAMNFKNALQKSVNYLIKKLDLSSNEFETQLKYLQNNIDNGETRITYIKKYVQDTMEI